GLLLSLRVRRRRLWLRLTPAGDDAGPGRTVVDAGGLARTDSGVFTAEFARLVERLRTGADTASVGSGVGVVDAAERTGPVEPADLTEPVDVTEPVEPVESPEGTRGKDQP
ncbi:MAG TPA: cytochrome c biogenesis protein ResB, partial [Mycobacteriales bacterium]|nr:cytochrome c biogenesis protein ResB [Mycobacteriales bacterium]